MELTEKKQDLVTKQDHQQSLTILGLLTVVGIFLLGFVLVAALSDGSVSLTGFKFSVGNSVVEPLVYAIIFAIYCFLCTKVSYRWAVLGGLPFLLLSLAPFIADGGKSEVNKQIQVHSTDIASLKTQVESVGKSVGGLKSSISNASIELVGCAYPFKGGWWHSWDKVLNKQCPANQVMVGANSKHSNHTEDRVRKYMCCSMRVVELK